MASWGAVLCRTLAARALIIGDIEQDCLNWLQYSKVDRLNWPHGSVQFVERGFIEFVAIMAQFVHSANALVALMQMSYFLT